MDQAGISATFERMDMCSRSAEMRTVYEGSLSGLPDRFDRISK